MQGALKLVYVGFMLGMFLYNLILWVTVRERIYVYYTVWVAAITCLVLGRDGEPLPWSDAALSSQLSPLILLLLAGGAVWAFAREFHAEAPGTDAAWRPDQVAFGVLVLLLLGYVLPPRAGGALAVAVCVLAVLDALRLSMQAIAAGYRAAYAFLGALIPLVLGGLVFAMQQLGALKLEGLAAYAAELGSALQVVLLSLALGARLTQMHALRRAAREMRQFNQALESSNTALAQANEALAQSVQVSEERYRALVDIKERVREEAEQRNRDKSRFLAQAAHDLRQPLQAVSNALLPVTTHIRTGAYEQANYLIDLAQQACHVMREQIGGLIDLSRLESGMVKVQVRDLEAQPLVRSTAETFSTLAQAKGVRLELLLDHPLPTLVRSDSHLLRQVLANLISNGIKYADPVRAGEQFVRVVIGVSGDGAWIDVQDNGLGIADEHLKSGAVFRPFFQVNNHLPETEKGVGLGLSIVSAVLALLPGHQLSVHSVPGEGSRFTLKMPLSDALQADELLPAKLQHQTLQDIRGAYILLLEDDVLVRKSTAALLDFHGAWHEAFASYAELETALPRMERCPDVLLSDFRLPGNRTALDAVRLVEACWGPVPTVVVSGDDPELVQGELGSPMVLLKKPVPPDQLLEALSVACRESLTQAQ